jgi:hypothetical protein
MSFRSFKNVMILMRGCCSESDFDFVVLFSLQICESLLQFLRFLPRSTATSLDLLYVNSFLSMNVVHFFLKKTSLCVFVLIEMFLLVLFQHEKAPYTDPKTKLHYCNAEVFHFIRNSLTSNEVTQYLELRKAHTVLKWAYLYCIQITPVWNEISKISVWISSW